MWQVLKAVTILFTICPGQHQQKILLVIFTKEKIIKTKHFLLVIFQGEKKF